MRLYIITLDDEDVARMSTRFAGSMIAARAARNKMADQFDVKKNDVGIEEIEVKTDKASLLETLNELCARADRPTEGASNGN